jgi:hypothetical protein
MRTLKHLTVIMGGVDQTWTRWWRIKGPLFRRVDIFNVQNIPFLTLQTLVFLQSRSVGLWFFCWPLGGAARLWSQMQLGTVATLVFVQCDMFFLHRERLFHTSSEACRQPHLVVNRKILNTSEEIQIESAISRQAHFWSLKNQLTWIDWSQLDEHYQGIKVPLHITFA